jgi:hypothetical protein
VRFALRTRQFDGAALAAGLLKRDGQTADA